MIKKNLSNIVLIVLLATVIALIWWRQRSHNSQIPDFLQGKASKDIVVLKSKIAGKLASAREVEIKSSVSGIIETLFVEAGDTVTEGMPLARIKPAPEPEELENARRQLQTCEIQFEMEKRNYERKIGLEVKGGISKSELEQARGNMELKELELKAAQKKLRLLLEGYLDESRKEDNLVVCTAKGIVLDLPVKPGQSVTKRNTYNDGTTIARVADMEQLLFKGQLGEYEISKIRVGMPLQLTISAYSDYACFGQVIRISPQARPGEEPVRFDFEASVNFPADSLIPKAGMTMVASFVAAQTDSVICVEEKYLHYSNDSVYVELIAGDGKIQRQIVVPGLSDGTKTEIKSGLSLTDRLKPVTWE